MFNVPLSTSGSKLESQNPLYYAAWHNSSDTSDLHLFHLFSKLPIFQNINDVSF